MTIGIISDTHGGAVGWQAAVARPWQGVNVILHAGDLLYHGPRNPLPPGYDPAALAELINHAPAPVIIARGNCDSDVDQLVLDFPIQAPYAFVVIEGLRIMVGHGDAFGLHDPLPGLATLAERYRLDVLISGHTHTPLLERAGSALIMNPGSPSLPKGRRGEAIPSVGLIAEGMARVVDLDGRTLLEAAIEPRARGAG
jgi:hypothetical protein